MKLIELLKNVSIKEIIGEQNIDIADVKVDSNIVAKNDLFICLNGQNYDGHKFVGQVETYGGGAVVTERKIQTFLTQIIVEDTRLAMSIIARNLYDNVDERLKLVAVVGTNGKTTTSHVIGKIANEVGVKCGVIGTLGVFYDGKSFEPTLTTPDPLELFKILFDMEKSGVKVVVMEVSAHAISLKKIYGMNFEIGVFTNFSRDHLDFFENLERYKQTKLSFFTDNTCRYVVSNADDEVGRELAMQTKKAITYGIYYPSDVFAINLNKTQDGNSFVINLFDCIFQINSKLLGEFNVYNLLSSATVSALLGIELEKIVKVLNKIDLISGRLERVYDGDFKVFVDYAHTPDGLEKSIKAIKNVCCGKVICIFGCGGNRDEGKRSIMGKVSGELADFSVITSDNPRYEEPMDIIYEIEKGVLEKTKNYVLIQDRAEAIKYAIQIAKKDDIILICGKGSENFQEVLGIKNRYNDKDTVNNVLGELL